MKVYIAPNPGKASANEVALRAAQILLNHGAAVFMQQSMQADCGMMGVEYLPQEQCLQQADVILTIGGDGTILHEANLSLTYRKPILGINLGRCGFLATCEVDQLETKLPAVAKGQFKQDTRMLLYTRVPVSYTHLYETPRPIRKCFAGQWSMPLQMAFPFVGWISAP